MRRTTAKTDQAFERNNHEGRSRESGEEVQACSDGLISDELQDGAETVL
jgi:hypothetical protein